MRAAIPHRRSMSTLSIVFQVGSIRRVADPFRFSVSTPSFVFLAGSSPRSRRGDCPGSFFSGVSVRLRWRHSYWFLVSDVFLAIGVSSSWSVLQASCPPQGLCAWIPRVVYPTSSPTPSARLIEVAPHWTHCRKQSHQAEGRSQTPPPPFSAQCRNAE
eukprot:4115719-Pyramimonas_sp.AAC.1